MLPANRVNIYLEIGKKKTFACALMWPGWSRGGRNEAQAVQALLASAPDYAAILRAAQIKFDPPVAVEAFQVVARLQGNTTTDFGAPDAVAPVDGEAMCEVDLARAKLLLGAYWRAFDDAVAQAADKKLRRGPRGGGRDLTALVQHVISADASYLNRLAWKFKPDVTSSQSRQLSDLRQATVAALDAAQQGNLPECGPRGGEIWSPRYFVRRSGWHTLDHLWEIADRAMDN